MLSTHILTSTKQHAKKKRILVLNWSSESISKDTLLAMLMLKKFEIPVFNTRKARKKLWRASLYFHPSVREERFEKCSTIRSLLGAHCFNFLHIRLFGGAQASGSYQKCILGHLLTPT